METHEEFRELCALSTSGDLTSDEQARLNEHLAVCFECRRALGEFEAAVNVGVPLLLREMAEVQPVRNTRMPPHTNWGFVWASFVAGILFMCALGVYTYRIGRSRSAEAVPVAAGSGNEQLVGLEQRLSDARREREALE